LRIEDTTKRVSDKLIVELEEGAAELTTSPRKSVEIVEIKMRTNG
jgi:hypothetical protein